MYCSGSYLSICFLYKKKSQQAIDKQTNKKGKEQTNVTDLLCVNGSTDERLEYYELEVVN